MGLTWQYVLRLPSLHRSFQPHTPQSPLPTYHPYSITHTTQHTVATTHSPSQLHLLYTQNSLNTPQITGPHSQLFPYSASSQLHGHTSHHKPLHLQTNKSSTTTSTCTIVVGTWKAPCTKLWLLVQIVKQLAGTIQALWHKSPALWSCTLGKTYCCLRYKSHTTRNPWYFTLYSLQCTPQPTIPTNQSYYIHKTQVHATIPKQRIGN